MLSLQKLVQDARSNGWACVDGQIDSTVYQASMLGWEIVPSRKGEPGVETLAPIEAAAAPALSLSAMTGLDAQPLHTDGAHHQVPPDIILLSVDAPSSVHTLLMRLSKVKLGVASQDAAEHGMFTVRSGNAAFLAPALLKGKVRFDPGCMTPGDARARQTLDFFASLGSEADTHDWSTGGQLLAIDNTKVLHARGAVHGEPDRTMKRVALRTKEAQA